MTFALTNVWSHVTWVTLSHAHLALFGTFGMLGIAAAYYAVPIMRRATDFDQRPDKLAFWLVFTGMLGLAFAFAIGGTIQVYVYRTLGLARSEERRVGKECVSKVRYGGSLIP